MSHIRDMQFGVLVMHNGKCAYVMFYPESPTDDELKSLREELSDIGTPLIFRVLGKNVAALEMLKMDNYDDLVKNQRIRLIEK
jgi:hypothetical protein